MKSKYLLYVLFSSVFLILYATSLCEASAKDDPLFMSGNRTYIIKPVYPVKINASQIPIGEKWTFIYSLKKGSNYHIYFIGDWIGSKTDYDIYIYDPSGNLVAVHTASAGFPEHLGNTINDPFFTPKKTGNYYFVILNDPKESEGEDAATLMVIEHLRCNRWYKKYIEGKDGLSSSYETRWAYEFLSNSERIEIIVNVPDTLDLYEVRLYPMANPSKGIGENISGYPVAWEPGLYGKLDSSGRYGGYNLDDNGFRHEELTASCEFPGQDLIIDYTPPFKGDTILYHLVFIGENGEGIIKFMIKTDFKQPSIKLQTNISSVRAGHETIISAEISDEDSLDSVFLCYTNNSWVSMNCTSMERTSEGIYIGFIPAYPKGNRIDYKVVAVDMAGNIAEALGHYMVKDETSIFFNISKTSIYVGEKIKVSGRMSHGDDNILLNFTSERSCVVKSINVESDGSFSYEFTPSSPGKWTVKAVYPGGKMYFGAETGEKSFFVKKIPTSIELSLSDHTIDIGESISVEGSLNPIIKGGAVTIQITAPNSSVIEKRIIVDPQGRFRLEFKPPMPGRWNIQACYNGDKNHLSSKSKIEELTVNETWMNKITGFLSQFVLYIAAAIGGTVALIAFIIYRRRSEYE